MTKNSLKVLMVYRPDVDVHGGAAAVMNETCKALRSQGIQAETTCDLYPQTEGFDIAHVFNIWSPPTALAQLKHLRKTGIPVIWSPIYLHWCECAWANLAFEVIYKQQAGGAEKERLLGAFAAGTLEINGLCQWRPNELYPGFHQVLKEMAACVDHLCVASTSEIQKLNIILGDPRVPFTVTPHGVDPAPFRDSSAQSFVERFKTEDFVLCVGAVDRRKNQLMLVEALKGTSMPLVLVGPSYEPDYLEVCKREAGNQLIYTGRLSPDLVASAYRAASVHVLPSFAEGAALANLEAAVSECAMVVSNRSSEFEYFGDGPFYCSPNDPASIAGAVRLARGSRSEKRRWKRLALHVEANFTWKRTAELTLEAYERTLCVRSKPALALEKNHRVPPGRDYSAPPLTFPLPERCDRLLGVDSRPCAGPGRVATSVSRSPQCEQVLPLLWSGPVFNTSGYADQARNLIKRLSESWPIYLRPAGARDDSFVSGMDPLEYATLSGRVKPLGSPYISLLSMPAYAFQRDPRALYNIGKTCFETDRLSPEWTARCNEMDEIWVPTQFNVETFRRSGVTVPIFIVPEGVDPDFYRPGIGPMLIPGRSNFAFLSVFEWTYRKGWDILLKAWAEAFSADDDVCLILRSYPLQSGKQNPDDEIDSRVNDYFRSIGRSRDELAPVIVLKDHVPLRLMPSLYASADAFVLPSRGEGWGRPYMEAMSCALPVIGTGWGGALTFMNDKNSYLIRTDGLELVDEEMELPYYKGQRWSSPCCKHLTDLLRDVFRNKESARDIGKKARADIEAHWTWDKSAVPAVARLREIAAGINHGRGNSTVPGPAVRGAVEPLCIRWEGFQFAWHSLALINRELCLGLIDAGHEISILRCVPEEFGVEMDPRFEKLASRVDARLSRTADIHVKHLSRPDFTPPPEGHWVMIQPWEYGVIPADWVEPMSALVDEIWAPSRYQMRSYIVSGVPPELVQVVPNGVNTKVFGPTARPFELPTEKKFRFIFVGAFLWTKGLDVLLKAYRQAFSNKDDVTLVIKEIGKSSSSQGLGSQGTIRDMQQDGSAPEIIQLTEMLSEKDMAGLFKSCSCMVHPYRAEGFALPVLEAMACGTPVAVTEGGATDDFCAADCAFLIPAQRKPFFHETIKFPGDGPGWVLEPHVDALSGILRNILENPADCMQRAGCALERVRSGYSWEAVSAVVEHHLQVLRSKPVRRLATRAAF